MWIKPDGVTITSCLSSNYTWGVQTLGTKTVVATKVAHATRARVIVDDTVEVKGAGII